MDVSETSLSLSFSLGGGNLGDVCDFLMPKVGGYAFPNICTRGVIVAGKVVFQFR